MSRDFWRAFNVNRWHTNLDFNRSGDTTGCHSARMVALALKLETNFSMLGIIHILSHDLGEYKVGDLPFPFKQDNPQLWREVEEQEEVYRKELLSDFWDTPLNNLKLDLREQSIIQLVDRLDCHLWALENKPEIINRPDWAEHLLKIKDKAMALGVWDKVKEILDE